MISSVVSSGRTAARRALLSAGAVSIAIVAVGCPPPLYFGVQTVGVAEDGAVYARAETSDKGGTDIDEYRSVDGGLTWVGERSGQFPVTWGDRTAETPDGAYELDGPDVIRTAADGRREVAHSTRFLRQGGNVWVQERKTEELEDRKLAFEPSSIVYDERSGNVIAAMGIQGVLVGAPDGRWTPAVVSRYRPTDFSFWPKTTLLLTNGLFWAASLALSLSMVAFGLIVSEVRRNGRAPDPSMLAVAAILALVALVAILVGWGLFILLAWVFFVFVGLCLASGVLPQRSRAWPVAALSVGIFSLLASAGLAIGFGRTAEEYASDPDTLEATLVGVALLAGLPALPFAALTLASVRHRLRRWRSVVASVASMNLLVLASFMLWLHTDVERVLVDLAALGITAGAAALLVIYISRKTPEEETACSDSGRPSGEAEQPGLEAPGVLRRLVALMYRLGATLLDWLLLCAPLIAWTFVYLNLPPGLVSLLLNRPPESVSVLFFNIGMTYGAILPYAGLAYGAIFVGAFATTAGKHVVGLRVLRPDGSRVGFRRALLRESVKSGPAFLITVVSLVILVIFSFEFRLPDLFILVVAPLAAFMVISLPLNVVMVAGRADQRGLHDLAADTVVVRNGNHHNEIANPGIP